MKIQLDLKEREARLVCTFIRRSIYEQYERNMSEAGMTRDQAAEIAEDTAAAFYDVREQIADALNKGEK